MPSGTTMRIWTIIVNQNRFLLEKHGLCGILAIAGTENKEKHKITEQKSAIEANKTEKSKTDSENCPRKSGKIAETEQKH